MSEVLYRTQPGQCPGFLKIALSLTIDSRAGNAFPDAPRKFTLLASAERVLKDTINIDGHNLSLREGNWRCRNHLQELSARGVKDKQCNFKSQTLRTENLQGFKVLMKTDVNDPGCCKWSIPLTAPPRDWPCFLVQTLFLLNIRIMNEMVVYYSWK